MEVEVKVRVGVRGDEGRDGGRGGEISHTTPTP